VDDKTIGPYAFQYSSTGEIALVEQAAGAEEINVKSQGKA
jgi:hypothetical protein